MAVPIPSIFDILGPALPLVLIVTALLITLKIVPPIVTLLRQRSYDTVVGGEMRRLAVSVGRGMAGSTEAAVALIRGLHPQRRLGADGWWPRGWPASELRTVWGDGRLYWQIDAGRDVLRLVEVALASADPGVEVRQVARRDSPTVWSAVARLRLPSSRHLGDPMVVGPAVLSRLASLLTSTSTPAAEVRNRVVVRPIDPRHGSGRSPRNRPVDRSRPTPSRTSSTRSSIDRIAKARSKRRCRRSSARPSSESGRGESASRSAWYSRWSERIRPTPRPCFPRSPSSRRRCGMVSRGSSGSCARVP